MRGPTPSSYYLFRDGAAWSAVNAHFLGMMEPSFRGMIGFGYTQQEAVDAYCKLPGAVKWADPNPLPTLAKFAIGFPPGYADACSKAGNTLPDPNPRPDIVNAGYVVTVRGLIHGFGATPERAMDMAQHSLAGTGTAVVQDNADTSNLFGSWVRAGDLTARPATAALIGMFSVRGSACSFVIVGGIACTKEEAA